ncbi:SpoIIE family protein phosphatase [Desulfobacterales bacterium HSG16]|nr:SpoIIE family protein phosphatase [Desulfobacterales bacterium HSG16]
MDRDKAMLDGENAEFIKNTIAYLYRNFYYLEELVESDQERASVNVILNTFPVLTKSIEKDLFPLLDSYMRHRLRAKQDFADMDQKTGIMGAKIQTSLRTIFEGMEKERQDSVDAAVLRTQQIALINNIIRFHSELILNAKDALLDRKTGFVSKEHINKFNKNIKFIIRHLDSLLEIVDNPYTEDEREAAESIAYIYPKLAVKIQKDLIRIIDNREKDDKFGHLSDVINLYHKQIIKDIEKIFEYIRLEHSEVTTLTILQNDKYTIINKIIRSHSKLLLLSARAVTFKSEGRINTKIRRAIDENADFIIAHIDELYNMAVTDEQDIAADTVNDLYPEFVKIIKIDLEKLIQEHTRKTNDVKKDLADLNDLLDRSSKKIDTAMSNILAFVHERQNKSAESLAETIAESTTLVMWGFLITFITIIPVFYLISRSIILPLKILKQRADWLAEGHLEQKIEIDQDDEIGSLARSFEYMRNSIREKILELQKNEVSLMEAEERFRSIFENAVEGIFQASPDGSLIRANPALAKMQGYDCVEELIDSGFNLFSQRFINPMNAGRIGRMIGKNGRIIGFESQLLRNDCEIISISMSVRAVNDEKGSLLYYEGSLIDVTEKKKKEMAERAREAAEAVNRKITESIQYAKMIQSSLLPSPEHMQTYFSDSFFIWLPRDIVGGDIIYFDALKQGFVIAVIDCTGHGVPGAFMTMIASSGLRRIVRDEDCHDPAMILKRLNFIVKTSLQQDTSFGVSDDGLDAAICFIPRLAAETGKNIVSKNKLIFAGARLPLIHIEGDNVNLIKGERQSIGYKRSDLNFNFTNHIINITKKSKIYMFTDGFIDQLGGQKQRRFGTPRFKNLLHKASQKTFEIQKTIILDAFYDHKKHNESQDDVSIIGFSPIE